MSASTTGSGPDAAVDGGALVTIARAATPFEAHIIAGRLRAADIEVFVFDAAAGALGMSFRPGAQEIPVQVAAADAAQARAELERDPEEDGHESDAGDPVETSGSVRDDDSARDAAALPEWARARPRMPWPARITFAITVGVVLLTVVGAIVMLFI